MSHNPWGLSSAYTLEQAALLLGGLDPAEITTVQTAEDGNWIGSSGQGWQSAKAYLAALRNAVDTGEIPASGEDAKVKKTDLRRWVAFHQIAPDFLFNPQERSIAEQQGKEAAITAFLEAEAATNNQPAPQPQTNTQDLSERSERSYLKTIGLLAKALASQRGSQYGTPSKPNIDQIAQLLEQYLPEDSSGLSNRSLRKRITSGIKALDQ